MRFLVALGALLAIGIAVLFTSAGGAAPRELGKVRWERDLAAAFAKSAQDGRPLFVLFQEVPGCSTCVSFGEQVLSNPSMVQAVETEFHPVFIYNNRPGQDARILKRFGEPSWNNPVVRLLDASGRDLIPRRAGVWTVRAMAARMVDALKASNREVPIYLSEMAQKTS